MAKKGPTAGTMLANTLASWRFRMTRHRIATRLNTVRLLTTVD
jgi:hypothetical protein